jgi:uncharacterized membrane protein
MEHYQHTEKRILWLTYVLYLLVVPSVLGLLINLFKTRQYKSVARQPRPPAELALLNSHHLWLERTFFGVLGFAMVALGTAYYGFGLLVAVGVIAWGIYRLVRGVFRLGEKKPMPVWV